MNVLEILLNRRWILKSRDRELYYQVKEKLASENAIRPENAKSCNISCPSVRLPNIPAYVPS